MSISEESVEFWEAYTLKKKLYGISDGWCENYEKIMQRISDELFLEFGIRP